MDNDIKQNKKQKTTKQKMTIAEGAANRLMHMRPDQLEPPMPNLTFHVLCEEDEQDDPIWKDPALAEIVSNGTKFRDTPGKLKRNEITKAVLVMINRAIGKIKYRIYDDFIYTENQKLYSRCLRPWKPIAIPKTIPELREAMDSFVISKAYHTNHHLCPNLRTWIAAVQKDVPEILSQIQNSCPTAKSKLDLKMVQRMRAKKLHFGICDKNNGYVVMSDRAYDKQMYLHLNNPKGTYKPMVWAKEAVFTVIEQDFSKLMKEFVDMGHHEPYQYIITRQFIPWMDYSRKRNKLSVPYPIIKMHKEPDERGCRSRMIQPQPGYPTANASKFAADQLNPRVARRPRILKDSRTLVAMNNELELDADAEWWLCAADVTALYPSMDIGRTLEAIQWFMDIYTQFSTEAKSFMIAIAKFILFNSYVEYKGVVYLQLIGAAMGTSSSVAYANIYMLKLEDQAFNLYRFNIELAERYLDDYYLLFKGSAAQLVGFRTMLNSADDQIGMEWQNHKCKAHAFIEDQCHNQDHQKIIYMDVNYQISTPYFDCAKQKLMRRMIVSPYHKVNNKFTYIPGKSAHSMINKTGWYYGEVCRALINSDSIAIWINEVRTFSVRLQNRGHKMKHIRTAFRKVNWGMRNKLLHEILNGRGQSEKHKQFLEKHKGFVFSIREFPGHRKLSNKQVQLHWLKSSHPLIPDGPIFPDEIALVFKSPITLRQVFNS